MALVQAGAVGASLLLLLTGSEWVGGDITLSIVVMVGLGLLRTITAGAALATSTLLLEPLGIAVFLSGTGAAASPFLPVALAGIWWAARSPRGRHARAYRILRGVHGMKLDSGAEVEIDANRPTTLVYGIALSVAYSLLVGPTAVRDGMAAEAIEDGLVLLAGWLMAQVAVRSGQAVRDRGSSSRPDPATRRR